MYNPKKINALALKYVETDDDKYCEELLKELTPLVNTQLARFYEGSEDFWSDLKQDVLLIIWKRRKSLKTTKSKSLYQYLYGVIRDSLSKSNKKLFKMNKDLREVMEVDSEWV